jgi:hypothetical protein
MEAQKCKICGARHHQYEPHQFPDEITSSPETPSKPDRMAREVVDLRSRAKFDRNAYQREYMRKRRARARIRKNP